MQSDASRPGRQRLGALAVCLLASCSAAHAAELVVTVDNIKENTGLVHVAVYGAAHWLDEDRENAAGALSYDLAEREGDGPVALRFELESGEYGAVVYQDFNENLKLDRNFIGVPKEPYGFSQGFDKLKRPKFKDCKFVVGEEGAAIRLTLKD